MGSKILRILLVFLLVLALILLFLLLTAQPARSCPVCEQGNNRPLVIAHQGGDGLWPGNTMLAFENAVALGVDWLEMDLHATADGALVLMHDATVDRTTNGTGALQEKSLQDLQDLDAGYYWSPDGEETFPYRDQGLTPANLAEVFEAFPQMPMNVEIKQVEPTIAEPLCQLIRQYGKQDSVLVASFHQQALDEFRSVCPEVSTSASQGEIINFFIRHKMALGGTYSPSAQAVQVPERRSGLQVLDQRFADDAHDRGLHVHAWTINDTADMQRLVERGVDGIITDRPDRLLELLNR
jgi:glycerophosphoryl diester phosphodiesterase